MDRCDATDVGDGGQDTGDALRTPGLPPSRLLTFGLFPEEHSPEEPDEEWEGDALVLLATSVSRRPLLRSFFVMI